MNMENEALSRLAAAVAAFIMAISWSVMILAGAYNQSLARIDNSFTQGFAALYLLADIEGAVERLNTEQQAFLTTGDLRFVDGVWSSVVVLDRSLEILQNL